MRWCEGLPERESRPLTPGERDRVADLRKRAAWRAAASALLVPLSLGIVPVAAVVVLEMAGLRERTAGMVVGVLALFAVLLGLPASLLLARNAIRDFRALGRDSRDEKALVFGTGSAELVVLAHSERLLFQGSIADPQGRRMTTGDASVAPASPATYALPLAEIPAKLQPFAWAKRALTPEERSEILRHAARCGRPPFLLMLVTGFAVLVAGERLVVDSSRAAAPPLILAAWAVMLGLAWRGVLRGRGIRRRLREDAENGWAIRATAGASAGDELLPISGAHWTWHGSPAPWRLSR